MVKTLEFLQAVRAEVGRIVWPTRRETLVTTSLVIAMVAFASLFLLAVDFVLGELVHFVLHLGSHG